MAGERVDESCQIVLEALRRQRQSSPLGQSPEESGDAAVERERRGELEDADRRAIESVARQGRAGQVDR